MNTYKQQHKHQSEPNNEIQAACAFDKFPQPRTIPDGWDLSELLVPVKPSRKESVQPIAQISPSTAFLETAPEPDRSESFEGGRYE